MFILRFDFRLGPQSDATMAELYSASLEMCEWGEANGAMMAMFSEHHGASDGYLPSPIVMASAAAARTTSLPINVGALLALMYDRSNWPKTCSCLTISAAAVSATRSGSVTGPANMQCSESIRRGVVCLWTNTSMC